MYMIENFGGWILDSKSGLIFGTLLMLATASLVGYEIWKSPDTVTLSAKEFVCVAAESHGLGTRCISYARVR